MKACKTLQEAIDRAKAEGVDRCFSQVVLERNGGFLLAPLATFMPRSTDKVCGFADVHGYWHDPQQERTVSQAAGDLNVSPGRVRAMLKSGVLEGYKPGRDWLIYTWSIERAKGRKAGRPKVVGDGTKQVAN